MGFQGLSEDVDGDGWVTKLWEKSIPGQRARLCVYTVCVYVVLIQYNSVGNGSDKR